MKAEEVFQRKEEQRRGEAGKAGGLTEDDNILNVRRPEFRKQACCVRSLWATENTRQVSSEHQNPKINEVQEWPSVRLSSMTQLSPGNLHRKQKKPIVSPSLGRNNFSLKVIFLQLDWVCCPSHCLDFFDLSLLRLLEYLVSELSSHTV